MKKRQAEKKSETEEEKTFSSWGKIFGITNAKDPPGKRNRLSSLSV